MALDDTPPAEYKTNTFLLAQLTLLALLSMLPPNDVYVGGGGGGGGEEREKVIIHLNSCCSQHVLVHIGWCIGTSGSLCNGGS